MRHVLAASLMTVCLVPLKARAAESLAWPNPSFELGTPEQLDGWEEPRGTVTIAFDAQSVHHGKRSLKLAGKDEIISKPVPIDPAQSYFFSLWLRRGADSHPVLIQCDGSGKPIEGAGPFRLKPGWRNAIRYWNEMSHIITALDFHPLARSLRLEVAARSTTVWVDDIQFHRYDPAEPIPTGSHVDPTVAEFYRERQVLLHVSFDRGGDSLDADYAAGDPHLVQSGRPPLAGTEVEPGAVGQAIHVGVAHRSRGSDAPSYHGPHNIHADQGTLAFWICGNWNKLEADPYTDRNILTVQGFGDYQTQKTDLITIDGGQPGKPIMFRIKGRDWRDYRVYDHNAAKIAAAADWKPGDWHHLAFTWTRAGGVTAYVDGTAVPTPRSPRIRPGLILPNIIAFSWHTIPPDMLVDEFVIFGQPLTADQLRVLADRQRGIKALPPIPARPEPDMSDVREAKAQEWGLANLALLPTIRPADAPAVAARIRCVPVKRVTDRWNGFRFSHVAADGKRQTRTFTRDPKREFYFDLRRPENINAALVMGELGEATLYAGPTKDSPKLASVREQVFLRWKGSEPFVAERVFVDKSLHSALNEVKFYHVEPAVQVATPNGVEVLRVGRDADANALALVDRYEADRDRVVRTLAAATADRGDIELAPMQTLHVVTNPMSRDLPLEAIELRLPLKSPSAETAVAVRVRQPINPRTLIADLDLHLSKANGVYRLIVDHPDWVIPAGRRLWLELTFCDAVTLASEAAVVLLEGDAKAVTEAYFGGLMEAMLGTYSALSEPRPWGAAPPDFRHTNYRELFDYVRELLRLRPADPMARAVWTYIRQRLVKVDLAKLLPGDAKAPEWARYQTALLMQLGEVVKHWCDRQGPDGRFSDNWGDDAELAVQWPFYTLITGDRDSAMAMQYASDHYWNDPRIKNGYVTWPMDALHSAEYTPVAEGPLLWVFYGEPLHIERLMTIAANLPKWMGEANGGHLHFKSSWVMADGQMDMKNRHNYDEAQCGRIVAPGWAVAYYNNNPTLTDIVGRWTRAWAEDVSSAEQEKPANTFPLRIFYPHHTFVGPHIGKHARMIQPYFYDAYLRTGDKFYLVGLGRKGGLPFHQAKCTGHWDTRERLDLYIETLKANLTELSWKRHLYTKADPSTDRVYFPADMLDRLTVGGFGAPDEGNLVTRIAASYEGTGLDVAPLVLTDSDRRLSVTFYNFDDGAKEVGMRVWELVPGTYKLRIGPDTNDDGEIDQVTSSDTIRVRRFTRVPVAVPARTLVVVELELDETDKLPSLLPDPALSRYTTTYDAAQGVLTVMLHNIGSADATDVRVTVHDVGGTVLAERTVDRIEAPLDLVPRRVKLTLAMQAKPAKVRLAYSGEQVAEVNDEIQLTGVE